MLWESIRISLNIYRVGDGTSYRNLNTILDSTDSDFHSILQARSKKLKSLISKFIPIHSKLIDLYRITTGFQVKKENTSQKIPKI